MEAGEKLKAALQALYPELLGPSLIHVPRFLRSLRGWRRMAPTRSRNAIPDLLMFAICAILLRRGHPEMALFNRALFSTYLRPSALLNVMCLDLLDAPSAVSDLAPYPAIIVAPEEREERTKTGTYDQTVILDDARDTMLGPDLLRHREARRRWAVISEEEDDGSLPLFGVQPAKFLVEWRSAVHFLQCDAIAHTPYQNRHGGPSRDIQLRLRSLLEVQRRGHWQSPTSLRNYEKAARLHRIMNMVPSWVQELGSSFRLQWCVGGPTSSSAGPL